MGTGLPSGGQSPNRINQTGETEKAPEQEFNPNAAGGQGFRPAVVSATLTDETCQRLTGGRRFGGGVGWGIIGGGRASIDLNAHYRWQGVLQSKKHGFSIPWKAQRSKGCSFACGNFARLIVGVKP